MQTLNHQVHSDPSAEWPIIICHLHQLVSILWLHHTVLYNELPRGSIDHGWLLLRWALLWAPPGLAFRHDCAGTLPSVDLSDDWKVGIPASAEHSLWEWIFTSCHPLFHWTGCISTVRASMTTRPRPGGKLLQGSRDMLTFYSRQTPE